MAHVPLLSKKSAADNRISLKFSGGGKGGEKRSIRPGRHCAGGGIWRGKNMEF